MELNNTIEPEIPSTNPVQNSIPEYPTNNLRTLLPAILGVLILLFIVSGGAYYLGTQKNCSTNQTLNNNTIASVQPALTQTDSNLDPSSANSMNDVNVYKHPKAFYTLEYPVNWNGSTEPIPSEVKQEYEDYNIRSSDYQLSEGYPILEKGVEILVRVENSNEKTIDEVFNKDPLAPQIAQNKIKTTVDGQEAIQYDYSYEGQNATITVFLNNGKYYSLKYRYANNADMQSELNTYLNLLKSFKTE